MVAVYFTGGHRRTERWCGRASPGQPGQKGYLVSRLQALLGAGRLHLPRGREAAALTDELLTYELRVNGDGHARAGAFRVGTHDDLVTAVGLAVQVDAVDWPIPPRPSAR